MAKDKSEHVHQRELVSWFRKNYNTIIHAIPNGEKRSIATAGRLKAEGVLAGVPDLYIPEWHLWVEMKTLTGRLSVAQKAIIPQLEGYGHTVLVCYGRDDAKIKIREFIHDKETEKAKKAES